MAREFLIRWLGQDGQPYSSEGTFVDADDYPAAAWEATRLLRAKIKNEPRAVEQGLYGRGFLIEETT